VNSLAHDPRLRRAIDDACRRLSFENLLYVTGSTTLMVFALAGIMSRHLPLPTLAGWVVFYCLMSLPRLGLALWFRQRPRTDAELQRQLPLLALALVLAAASWSVLPFLTPHEDTTALVIQLLFAGGLVAGGTQAIIGTPRILLANTLLLIGPYIVRMLGTGVAEHVFIACVAIFYYLAMLHFGRRSFALLRESIALRLHNQRLVADLTLAKEQAERARDAAERATDDKNRFLAAASHDIRQPMHAALLFLGALQHDVGTRGLPVVARLQAALTAARQMLDTLLDVSLLDAGAVRRSDTVFRAADAGQQLIELFDPVAAGKGVALGLRCPPGLWLHTDPTLMQRVLVNLVGNAVKYTACGAVLISFRRRGCACLVQVWDTGVGIPVEQQARIFDEFTQLDNPQRDRSRGTGLGLTIVRRLCRLLGTEITLRSRPGHGSVFAFTLPQGQPARPGGAAGAAAVPPAPACILVVDDDELVREGLGALLAAWGHAVRFAADVDGARRALQQGAMPALALIDHRLPDGLTAADAIRVIREAVPQPLPVIVITGDTHPQRIREAQALGHPVIFKPVPADVLQQAVNEALSRPSQATA
jgi:signal transduction histidine kinase/CheY-like chemotaxis protein